MNGILESHSSVLSHGVHYIETAGADEESALHCDVADELRLTHFEVPGIYEHNIGKPIFTHIYIYIFIKDLYIHI